MAAVTPVRGDYNQLNELIGLAEFQASEYVDISDGGTGATTASGARTALGLEIGTDIQSWDQQLDDISALAVTDGGFIVGDGNTFVLETGDTARTSLGLGTSDSPTFVGLTLTGGMTISGDLTVSGTTTTISSNIVEIGDSIIELNSDYSGSTPTENAGLEVNRGGGTEPNKTLIWDETNDYWTIGGETFVAGNFAGAIDSTAVLADGVTATTQSPLDNSTKVATTEYVDSAVAQENELAEMNDVTLTNSQDGDFLRYNGSVWINDAVDLATDTVGDFVQSIIAGDGLAIDITSGEQQTPTLSVNVDDSSIEIATDTLQVKALGITNAMLAGSIENAKLVNSDITFTDGTTATVASLGDTITFTGGTGVTIANTAGNFDVSFDIAEVKSQVDEYAQDALNDAFTAGTQTRITVAYDDNANSLSYTVDDDLANYDNTNTAFIDLTDLSATTSTGVTYDNATGVIELASIPNASLTNSKVSITDGTTASDLNLGDTLTFTGGTGVTITNTANTIDVSFNAAEVKADLDEYAQDAVIDALTSGTQTRITVGYDDNADSISLTVDDDLANYDNTNTAFIDLADLSVATGSGLTYNSSTGEFGTSAIPNSQLENSSVTINANSLSLGGTLTLVTDDIAESVTPTNLYFTDERAQDAIDSAFSAGTHTLITYAYDDNANSYSLTVNDDLSLYDNASSAFITLTDLSGGTGVTYDNLTGQISIGQEVETTSDVQFNSVQVDGTLTSDDITSTNISIAGNATITGNLTVQGTTTTIDSNTVNIGDNTLVLNADETGAPSQDAGIEIERGTDTNVSFIWDESAGKWTVDELGSHTIVATTFEGNLTGDVTGNVSGTAGSLLNAQDFSLTGDVTASAVSFDGTGAVALTTTIGAGAVEFAMMDGAAVITGTETIASNATDDTSFPTTKAVVDYVAAQTTAVDLDIAGDTGTGTIDLDTQSLTLTGGTGITTTAANQAITVDIDSTVVTLDGTQTLSNKTLEATTIAGHLIPDTDVSYDLGSSTFKFRDLYLSGTSIYLDTNTITLNSGNYEFSDGSNIITMPIASTDTLVARETSDTLSNKTVVDTDNVMVKTFEVDVHNGKYRFNGVSEAVLNLEANVTYRFDLSHTTLATDEFALSETEDGENTQVSSTDTSQSFDGEGIDEFFQFEIVGHGYSTGDEVIYDANGLFEIGGLTDGDTYYIIVIDVDTLQLAASASDATAGTEIELVNSAQSGNHDLITRTYTYGTEYTTGVTSVGTQGQAGAYKDLRVHTTTPVLFPYSKNNSNRGGQGKGRPESAGRFVGLDTEDTIVNKTIDLEQNTIQITYAVTVATGSDGNNKYFIDGEETASLALVSGFTYIFDLSDSSTASHPFALNTEKDGTGTNLTSGVTTVGTQGSAGAYLSIAVNSTTPDLVYYYCSVHSGMGGDAVLTVAGADLSTQTTDDLTQGSTNLYYSDTYVDNHLQGGTGIDYNAGVISVDDGIITSQSVKGTPVGTDQVLIYDVAGTALKRITISDIVAQAGAGSMNSFTLSDGSLTTPVTDGDTVTINGTTDEIEVSVGTDSVTIGLPDEVTTDVNGAIHVKGKNESGATITKGTPVYISGQSGSGQEFTVDVADADDSAKMPAVGIAYADSNNNSQITIVTHGKFIGIDTSSFTVGDDLYISTTGTLTNTAPTGEASGIQKIAKVIRVHPSDGQIYVMGASRTNATPNLDDGDIFIGNASNQAVTASLDTKISDYLGAGGDITIGGNLIVQGTTTTIDSTSINVQNAFVFEGATDDAFETTLTVVDPTADRTINLPDNDGTVLLDLPSIISDRTVHSGTLDTTNDTVLLYDASITALRQISVSALLASAGSGNMSSFLVGADSGTAESVTDGQTLTITGGTGIDTTVSASDTVTIDIDSTVITTSSSVNDLSDVNASGAQNEQVLQYNTSAGEWQPAYVSGGGGGGTPDSIQLINFLGIEEYIPVTNSEVQFTEYDGSSDNSDPLPITGSVLDFQETTDGVTFTDDDIQLSVSRETFQVISNEEGTTSVSTTETTDTVSFFTQGKKRFEVDELGVAIGEDGMGYRNNDTYDETQTVPQNQNMMMVGPITFGGTITVEGRLVVV